MSHTGAIPKGGARPKIKQAAKLPGCSTQENESLPLEKKFIEVRENKLHVKKPALDSAWVVARTFMNFTAPPETTFLDGTPIMGASEAWIEQMEFMESDLECALELPHHQFWSQVVHSKGIHECLDSFLANRPRWFEKVELDEPMTKIMNNIDELVFKIFVRMSTFKESTTDHITPSVFGEIIYNNFLFDSCKLLDLCVLYGQSNRNLLEKMVNNIFTHQPLYYEDLKMLVSSLIDALENVDTQLGIGNKLRLGNGSNAMPIETLNDIIMYLLDNFASLHAFFTVFPKAVSTFHQSEYYAKLSVFYDKIIPVLSEHLASVPVDSDDFSWAAELEMKLSIVRTTGLAVFNDILHYVCLKPLEESRVSENQVDNCMSNFVNILSNCTAETTFITDYYSAFSLDSQIDLFTKVGADMTNLNFIKEGIECAKDESKSVWTTTLESALYKPVCEEVEDTSGMNGYCDGEQGEISDIDISCMISNIQDLLCDLGAGFIRKCLKYYNYSSEDVLNAILEDKLPSVLDSLDRSMVEEASIPEPEVEEKPVEEEFPSLLEQRHNVYDYDEFDVFHSKNINFAAIHKGKKEKIEEVDADLKFKLKQIARAYDNNRGYSIYEDELKYSSIVANDYNDEYDDTYDDNPAKDVDNFGNDRKGLTIPNIRGQGALNKPLTDSEESESDEESSGESKQIEDKSGKFRRGNTSYANKQFYSGKNRREKVFIPFCENPEVLRERAAQRRLSKRGGNTGWTARPPPLEQPNPEDERPKIASHSKKKSGKTWRNDNPDEAQGSRGGKYAKDTNHGKSQDKDHRHKMIHKNEHKREGAQRKYNSFR